MKTTSPTLCLRLLVWIVATGLLNTVFAGNERRELPAPPADVAKLATVWIPGDEPSSTNMSTYSQTDSFSGVQLNILKDSLPEEGKYFAEYIFEVKHAGKHEIYAAMQRQNVGWSSPAAFILDKGQKHPIEDSGTNSRSWGLSKVTTWVNLGTFVLEKGIHRIEIFTESPRKMDKKYSLLIDSIALFNLDQLVKVSPDRMVLPPPPANVQLASSVWLDGTKPLKTNMNKQAVKDCFNGRYQLYALNSSLPAEGKLYADYKFLIDKESDYLIAAAMQRQQVGYSSPAYFSLDAQKLQPVEHAGTGISWGFSDVTTWVTLGSFRLSKGTHSLELLIRDPREMDGKYAFLIDSIAVFDLRRSQEVHIMQLVAHNKPGAGGNLEVRVQATSDEAALLSVQLRYQDRIVAETPFVNDAFEKTVSLQLPEQMASGTFQLVVVPVLNDRVKGKTEIALTAGAAVNASHK